MKVLVSEMPKKKEECLFFRKQFHSNYGYVTREYCFLTNKSCSFKNGDSIFGGECRCLKVGLTEQ